MSVPNQTPYVIYNANGMTTVFPFEFYIIAAGDIQVSINGTVATSGYSVSGSGNVSGGSVAFLTPPANGDAVMLERVVPTYRLTDYQDNGDLLADTINKDFDRLWMAIQRSSIYLGLALRRPLLGGPFNADGYRIANLTGPVSDLDAANKEYVDDIYAYLLQTINTALDTIKNGLYGYNTKRSFELGNTLSYPNDILLQESSGEWFRWDGTLPKVVPAGSTPESAGGIGEGKWVSVGDASLRGDLATPDGYKLIGGLPENYGWPANTIVVDRPPFNGNLRAALNSIPASGNKRVLLGESSSYDLGGYTNTKPNVAIIGTRMPKADMTSKTLVAGSGSIIRGYIVNNAAGFTLSNLGIDNSDTVRTTLLGGTYADAYCNENFPSNANIQYGDLVIMQADTHGGTVGLQHGIRSEWGSGVRQIGDVSIFMGYHGHVVKVSDFTGSSYTTYCQGTHADSAILKADTGTGPVTNIRFGNVICDGGDPVSAPIATTGGVVYEAAGATLSGVSIGDITARNARYAFITATTTTAFCSQISVGHIDAANCDDGTNLTTVIDIWLYTVGLNIKSHNVRNCRNMIGVRVSGPSSTNPAINNNSIHIGSGQSCNNLQGYNLAGGVTHGALYAESNVGWGFDFHGYAGPGSSAATTFSGIGVNQSLISGRANGSGLISGTPSAISALLGTWTDSLSFKAEIIGGMVRISGQLAKGAAGQANAVQMLSHAFPASVVPISAWGTNGSSVLIPVEANIGPDGILNVPGFASIASTVSFYGEYRIK
jgi:hypothetical protein